MTTSLEHKIQYIKECFIRDHFKVCDDWISGCVEYFIEDDPRTTNANLYNKAKEQYFLADFEEVGLEILPDSLVNYPSIFTLNGNYVLQMQYLIDISQSPYDQLKELYNQQVDETEEEVQQRQPHQTKKKRVLKLQLTDGHKTVFAIEYRPIACLSTKLAPGCKVLLKGPVRCSNKVILMEPKNISILGGELEKLAIINAFENVLLKAVDKPINPKPKTEYNEKQVIEQAPSRTNPQQLPTRRPTPPPVIPTISNEGFEDDDIFLDINLDVIEQNEQENFRRTSPEPGRPISPQIGGHISPDIIPNEDINDEDVIGRSPDERHTTIPNRNWIDNADDGDDDVIMLAACDIKDNGNKIEELPKRRLFTPPPNEDDFDMLQYENEIEEEFRTIEANQNENSQNICLQPDQQSTIISKQCFLDANYQFKIDSHSLVTIKQLNAADEFKKRDKYFIIKGEIVNVVEKLQIKNCRFSMAVELIDGSDTELKVYICDEVLTNIAGVSARELQIMRRQIPDKPHMKAEIEEILSMLKESLTNLNNFMKIDFSDPSKPVLVQLIDTTDLNERLLQDKLKVERD